MPHSHCQKVEWEHYTYKYKLNEHKDGWWTFMKQFVQMIKISKICTCTMNDVNLMLLSIKLNIKFDVW